MGSPLLLLPASQWLERKNSCGTRQKLFSWQYVSLQSFTIYVVLHHIIYSNFALCRTFCYSFALHLCIIRRHLTTGRVSNINYDIIDPIMIIVSERILSLFLSTYIHTDFAMAEQKGEVHTRACMISHAATMSRDEGGKKWWQKRNSLTYQAEREREACLPVSLWFYKVFIFINGGSHCRRHIKTKYVAQNDFDPTYKKQVTWVTCYHQLWEAVTSNFKKIRSWKTPPLSPT